MCQGGGEIGAARQLLTLGGIPQAARSETEAFRRERAISKCAIHGNKKGADRRDQRTVAHIVVNSTADSS